MEIAIPEHYQIMLILLIGRYPMADNFHFFIKADFELITFRVSNTSICSNFQRFTFSKSLMLVEKIRNQKSVSLAASGTYKFIRKNY